VRVGNRNVQNPHIIMRNCIVLGSGRSGTSMLAGTLGNAGYFMGEGLLSAREANPKGFYEDREVNDINETILDGFVPQRVKMMAIEVFRDRPLYGHRWLARVPVGKVISLPSNSVEARISTLVCNEPYCFKDPRFSYTLPAWKPFLRNAVFICVFRNPGTTVNSIIQECRDNNYNLRINFRRALEVWTLMYRHITETHRHHGEWLFLHYNQVLTRLGLDKLESFTGASVDRSFPDPSLNRSPSSEIISQAASRVYRELCRLADYN